MIKYHDECTLCEVPQGAIRHPNRGRSFERARQAERFLAGRNALRMTQQELAKSFKVNIRTVQNWESGRTAIPQPAYKLIRIMSAGKYLGPQWRDFFVHGDTLTTPEGHQFRSGDLAWWSLLIRQADAFRVIMDKQRKAAAERAGGASATTVSDDDAHHAGAPQMSLAQSLLAGVRSRPSMPAVDPTEQRRDPEPGSLEDISTRTSGRRQGPADVGINGSKSLKSKGFPTESLSLTIHNRPAETHPASPAPTSRLDSVTRHAKQVRA